ncbi:M48 family metallopeptidase [Candidatus Saccharibacteria bacterium]|jgi:predicted metal-dependent hydrolase|nr:M48 family metallopeptidase [Candidatus Saccharibacteria bacterium]
MISQTFTYGNHKYTYGLLRQDRKTLSLTVEPCLTITLKAPLHADDDRIEKFLKKKWMWLHKQLTFFEKYRRKHYSKEYIAGESFYYLGRQYQLNVVSGKNNSVALSKGKLTITTTKSSSDNVHNRVLLDRWYKKRRANIYSERFDEVFKRFDYRTKPELTIRVMQKRWGSFVKGERVVLNPLLIHASKEAIDYVITHELCHMKYKNHDAQFYALLESKFPGWQKIKERLELQVI